MEQQAFDVVVIGGGINGAGVALDAAGRGYSVCLVEKGDLAGATSSSSSKLIHGGLRYLEHYEFRLVREALSEREVLLKKAPHIMWPLRFRLPHQRHLRPTWMVRTGLFLYDHLAKRVSLPGSRKVKNKSDSPLVKQITTCFEYSDGWVDDARLVVLNAIAAREKGADIRVRTECVSACNDGDMWSIRLQDQNGEVSDIRAKTLVNAAGPWAASFIDRVAGVKNPHAMRMVKGSHIVVPRMYDDSEAYILQNEDQRIVFVIPYEDDFTLIGTTDENYTGDPAAAQASSSEIEYLVGIVNEYFKTKVSTQSVVHSFSGVRPLLEEANASAQELTRDYKVEVVGNPGSASLINIFGGKITTYRKLAQQTTDRIVELHSKSKRELSNAQLNKTRWTAETVLPGGDFDSKAELSAELTRRFPWLTHQLIRRFVRQYGTLCLTFLSGAQSEADLGVHFGGGLYQSEVDYLVQREWAKTTDDIIWRRTKQGLVMDAAAQERLTRYLKELVELQKSTLQSDKSSESAA